MLTTWKSGKDKYIKDLNMFNIMHANVASDSVHQCDSTCFQDIMKLLSMSRVMACCLMAPSHYQNQHQRFCVVFSWEKFHMNCSWTQSIKCFGYYTFTIITSPRGHWVKKGAWNIFMVQSVSLLQGLLNIYITQWNKRSSIHSPSGPLFNTLRPETKWSPFCRRHFQVHFL